jgi:hypothetical protein
VSTGGGVRTEELETRQAQVQLLQAVPDDLVSDVTFEVDDKAVVAEALLGWA